MSDYRKRQIFKNVRENLIGAGLGTRGSDSLICPLCWKEASYSELSLEHIVPKRVGGRAVTLTCTQCNNSLGSDLDAHLARFQSVKDALKGHGTLPVEMNVAGNRVVANLEWKEGHKNFVIVEAASDPGAIAAIKKEFGSGVIPKIDFTIFYKYATNNFNTAVLRSAYLVLFDRFGYAYARHETVQAIRRRICDLSITQPDLSSLVLELESDAMPFDGSHFISRRNVNGIDCFLVIVRVRRATTTYLGAFMPNTSHPIEQFEALMEQYKQQNNGKSMTIRRDDFVI